MSRLSVIVNTKNAAPFLRSCLQSVQDIADEIVLVDMASTDQTLSIAAEFPAVKVYQYPNPDVGYADPARQFAFDRATGDWLVIIDADEQFPEKLARRIRQIVDAEAPTSPAQAYYFPRRNEIFGYFFTGTGWYPDYQLRLWRRDRVHWREGVHSQPEISGKTARLPANDPDLAIIHHNYQHIDQYLARMVKYTTAAAQAADREAPTPEDLWQSFFGEFWRRAFRDDGLLEGNHGLVLSLFQATYELIVQAKIWENAGFSHQELDGAALKRLHRRFQREAHYWWADLMVRRTQGLSKLIWRFRRKFKI